MYPKKIKVGNVHYSIKMKKQIETKHKKRVYLGVCKFIESEIQLLDSMPKSRKHDIFAHELLHAMIYEAGFDEHDEDFVNRTAKVLLHVLRENDFSFLKD